MAEPPGNVSLLERLRADLIGRYQVERELRSGGMATVFVATDLRHHRRVAIKLLRPELAVAVGPRFLQEIDIAARLTHPHILSLHDSGEAASSLFYVMPFIADESLAQRLARERQLPVPEAVRIAREVADALAYAHANGIVHRDIKPGNILLSARHAIVADFGIAHAVSVAGDQALSSAGLVLGTPAYMSPEQASGASAQVDGRSDIYSLGCVLYEMVAGVPPFTGATPQAVFARHQLDPPPSLRTVRSSIPPPVERAIGRALAKVPADRFQTAEEFSEALDLGRRPATRGGPRDAPPLARWTLVALVLGLLAGASVWRWRMSTDSELDGQRIVVYPFAVGGQGTQGGFIGEDAAAALVAALNSTKHLKGFHGWRLLSRDQVPRNPSPPDAERLAREVGAGYYLDARVIPEDSIRAVVEVHDMRGDSSFERTLAFAPSEDAWTIGVSIARDLLPFLLLDGGTVDLAALGSPNSAAAASYLLGERAYRRGRFHEASDHFLQALERDSSFAIAAVMGAQAAGWGRLEEQAKQLSRAALRHRAALAPRYARYLDGMGAWWAGLADSAVAQFRAALRMDQNWPEAWTELGEVYSHLLPSEPDADSLQLDAFERAHRLDPAFLPPVFHLIEIAVRRGNLDQAERLKRGIATAGVDPAYWVGLDLMLRCVKHSPAAIDWRQETHSRPVEVVDAGGALAVAGLQQAPCAEAAWRGYLAYDTTPATESNLKTRYRAVAGLQALLLAQGRHREIPELLRAAGIQPERVATLRILAALAGAGDVAGAAAAADSLARTGARGPLGRMALWAMAIWAHHRDDTAAVRTLADTISARARKAGASAADTLLAGSLAAWLALGRGDTARTVQLLAALAPIGDSEQWDALGLERATLAEIYLARAEYASALRIASFFDAPGSVSYVAYLPVSLRVRARAARALGNDPLASRMDRRLAALSRGARNTALILLPPNQERP
jgi:serine/threonine-protein kinase